MDKENIKGTYQDTKGAVKSGVGNLTGNRGLEAEGYADRVEGAIRQRVGDLKDTVGDAAGSAQEALRPLTQELEARIQRNPTGAMLMAAGLGFVLALMMGRR